MCEACNNKGWLVLDEDHRDKLVIQRCDRCEKFNTDNDAVLHVEQMTTETLKLRELITWLIIKIRDSCTTEDFGLIRDIIATLEERE